MSLAVQLVVWRTGPDTIQPTLIGLPGTYLFAFVELSILRPLGHPATSLFPWKGDAGLENYAALEFQNAL